jgi:hypothetical protein
MTQQRDQAYSSATSVSELRYILSHLQASFSFSRIRLNQTVRNALGLSDTGALPLSERQNIDRATLRLHGRRRMRISFTFSPLPAVGLSMAFVWFEVWLCKGRSHVYCGDETTDLVGIEPRAKSCTELRSPLLTKPAFACRLALWTRLSNLPFFSTRKASAFLSFSLIHRPCAED